MNIVDIADLDCIFLTYDEPKKEEFWTKIKNIVPWAVRVDGVKGSDAAHKAAADASETERFILIDGDNLPSPEFFDLQLEFENEQQEQAVFRWRARNNINGLMYGNGGISSWTKDFVQNMKTHENSDGSDKTLVEFCFDDRYWAMHDCYSTTYPNGSEFHSWRAGFREGVKMCLDRGYCPSVSEFRDKVHERNLDHLTIWQNVGLDVDHGSWAIAGARQGTFLTMLDSWDYRNVQDFSYLEDFWNSEVRSKNPRELISEFGERLSQQLDLADNLLDENASKFFKHHYRSNWKNLDPMITEHQALSGNV